MSEKYHNVIGIDLGTTYSAVATYNKYLDSTEIINTPKGSETIPSVVSFDKTNQKVFAGQEAKTNFPINPENTIVEIKREMGEVVNERNIEEFNKLGLPVKLNEDPYRVMFANEWYLPQEISAFTLMEVKTVAQNEIGELIQDAVITVPAYFTEKQKKATEEAALLAGLYPRQLIPEPTAAAICYGIDQDSPDKRIYLVYDFGGGTFDVSIIEAEDDKIIVVATSGNERLGGSDFDNAITDWVVKLLKDQHQIDISEDTSAKSKIKAAAEDAKKILSKFDDATIDVSFLQNAQVATITITRKIFEDLIESFIDNSINEVNNAIAIAQQEKGIEKDQIDQILLVGGSTKVPKVKEKLLAYFGKGDDFVSSEANPDTVVARGAAIMARKFEKTPGDFSVEKRNDAILMTEDSDEITDPVLITEHSLSVGVQNDMVAVIIERGRTLPAKEVNDGFINGGPSEYIPVSVFQGESKYAYENTLIGTLNIGPMEPKPAGSHQFEVTFNIDENGLLDITILHLNENKPYSTKFVQNTGIGGDDKLEIVRLKLKDLFWNKADGNDTVAPPIDIENKENAVNSEDIPDPINEGIDDIPAPIANADIQDKTHIPEPVVEQKVEKAVPSESVQGNTSLLVANNPVPEQFTEVISDVKKINEVLIHDQLIQNHNIFIKLLNENADEDQLADAIDEVADIVDEIKLNYENGLRIPKNEIPAQFHEIQVQCKEAWLKSKNNDLQKAYNAFIEAINLNAAEEDVLDLGDELCEVLEAMPAEKDSNSMLEPTVEVPDKYKMIVRRSKKQLLKENNENLFEAYNNFISGINNGNDEAQIAELNNLLNEAFLKAKN